MDQILVLQYRRKGRVLQIIALPYSMNISASALIRFVDPKDCAPDPTKDWRVVGIIGHSVPLHLDGVPEFVGDAMMGEIFETAFLAKTDGLVLEAKGVVDTRAWDMGDLVGGRVPRDLLTRITEQVDNWR